MKAAIILFFCMATVFQCVRGQYIQRSTIGFTQNIDIWKPYNRFDDGSDLELERKSNTYTAYGLVTIMNQNKFVLKAGPAFKHISYRVVDRIQEFKKTKYAPGMNPVTTITKTNVDFVNRSANLGLMISLERKFGGSNRMTAGLTIEGYCFEFYKSEYELTNIDWVVYNNFNPKPSITHKKDIFHLSNLNASVFYAYHIVNRPWFSTTVKASLGINGYSAWDQFSRYAWLGLGLEVGFGKLKVKE